MFLGQSDKADRYWLTKFLKHIIANEKIPRRIRAVTSRGNETLETY